MLFGSLVELHHWLHSYMCCSLLEKLFLSNLDSSSTPGYLSTTRWIDQDFFWILDSFSTTSGSIELPLAFCWFVPQQILDSCICQRFVFSTPGSTDVLTPLSVEIYWTSIYRFCAIRFSFLSISFSIASSFHLPTLSHSLQTSSSRFLQAFSSFSSLDKLRISHLHAFHVLKPRF